MERCRRGGALLQDRAQSRVGDRADGQLERGLHVADKDEAECVTEQAGGAPVTRSLTAYDH